MNEIKQLDQAWSTKAFDTAARKYDEAAVLQRHVGDELIERCLENKGSGGLTLDLGCGTGYLSRKLRLAAPEMQIIGLDCAFSMAYASQSHTAFSLCADAHLLPFEKNSFDLILSNMAIQWCDFNQVLREVYRVLAPGGRWFFSSVGPDTLLELRSAWAVVDNKPHVHEFADLHHLGDSMLKLGFKDPVLDIDRINMTYESVKTLLSDLRTLGVVNAHMDRQRGLTGPGQIKAMMNAYENFRGEDNLLPSTWEIIYGQAVKPVEHSVNVQFDPGIVVDNI